MAIATTKYSPSIKEWNLQFREEAVYDSIVSNVAHLSSYQAEQILSEAKVKASQTEEPANKQAFYEIDGIDKLIRQERARQAVESADEEGVEEKDTVDEQDLEFPMKSDRSH